MKLRKILFLSLLMASFSVQSQIVYTDITDGIPLGIDFNNDGTYEFDISAGFSPGTYLSYFNYGADNNVHAIGNLNDGGWDIPNCVALGYTVGTSGNWQGQGDCSIVGNGEGNTTITFNQDEYLAVRFNLGGTSIYYGWIRFSMTSDGEIIYKDYGYNATAGAPINAGQTTALNIKDLKNDSLINIFPNPSNGNFVVEVSNLNNATIKVFDSLGRVVFMTTNVISNSINLNLAHLEKGTYYLKIDDVSASSSVKTILIN